MLKNPIKLSSSVRDMNGIPIALAETIDGGETVVVWDKVKSSWKPSQSGGIDVRDVMRSPDAQTSKNYPKLLNEYIFFGKPESQLPREIRASEKQLNILRRLTPEKIDRILYKYGNIIPLSKVKNNQKEKTSTKTKKENKFKLWYEKFTQKYPIISLFIIFFLLFYVAIKLIGFIFGWE